MIEHQLRGHGSFICGSSVHNQRIERLWRDLFQSCLVSFYDLFYDMEDNLLLDVDNPTYVLFIMHFYQELMRQFTKFFLNGIIILYLACIISPQFNYGLVDYLEPHLNQLM